jgi:hypothetical protein
MLFYLTPLALFSSLFLRLFLCFLKGFLALQSGWNLAAGCDGVVQRVLAHSSSHRSRLCAENGVDEQPSFSYEGDSHGLRPKRGEQRQNQIASICFRHIHASSCANLTNRAHTCVCLANVFVKIYLVETETALMCVCVLGMILLLASSSVR